MKTNPTSMTENTTNDQPDSLHYSPEDDIYNKAKKIPDLNPDDNSVITGSREKDGEMNEKSFEEDMSGSDLDIPGAELDDLDEEIGEEDEENNYYSLGGDNHENLEESRD